MFYECRRSRKYEKQVSKQNEGLHRGARLPNLQKYIVT